MSVETSSPRIVRLGKLSLKLDPNGAFAREITLDGEEIFRGIGFVARDANWGTPALPATVAVTASENRVVAETGGRLDQAAGDLEWRVAWTVTPTGVEARASFTSARGFPTNRTGFVVLHSLPAARGRSVRVAHPGGASEDTRFPDLISPHQPFFDIVALDYRTAAGHHVAIAFEGELFEIEDQRNWTDASYKTYCRPLARPYPYRIEPGETIEQVVRLTLAPADARARAPASAPKVVAQALMPLFGTHLPPGPAGRRPGRGARGPDARLHRHRDRARRGGLARATGGEAGSGAGSRPPRPSQGRIRNPPRVAARHRTHARRPARRRRVPLGRRRCDRHGSARDPARQRDRRRDRRPSSPS